MVYQVTVEFIFEEEKGDRVVEKTAKKHVIVEDAVIPNDAIAQTEQALKDDQRKWRIVGVTELPKVDFIIHERSSSEKVKTMQN